MSGSDVLFRRCLAVSLALHGGLLLAARLSPKSAPAILPPIEIDLSMAMFSKPRLGFGAGPSVPTMAAIPGPSPAPKLAAPQALIPGTVNPAVPSDPEGPRAESAVPAKEWVTPGPSTEKIEKIADPGPAPGGVEGGTGSGLKPGGEGTGTSVGDPNGTRGGVIGGVPGGAGSGGGIGLTRYPRLLNKDELLSNIQRFYPKAERKAGNEGKVVLVVHIGADGRVEPGEIVQSASPDFDEAAKKVAKLMRFDPALGPDGPVAVKVKQSISFKLE
ncbi:MAG: TonB family protein [Elusimicrobiota bacterium]